MEKKEVKQEMIHEQETFISEKNEQDPFAIQEIEIEEVSIDGICGVY